MKCPHCKKEIDDKLIVKESARIRGKVKSEKKKKSSINNGKKGGRPPKEEK
ncbi:MAG TPA: hypothetical protein PLD55_04360 [bacterium]|nr:hypothetical protein [bacterium]